MRCKWGLGLRLIIYLLVLMSLTLKVTYNPGTELKEIPQDAK